MNQQYASVWSRYIATLIDGFIIGIIFIVPAIFLVMTGNKQLIAQWSLVLNLASWALSIAYYVVYQAKKGQTIGKKTMGIKVVNAEGKTPSMLTFFLREEVGKLISGIILMIGYLIAIWDPKKQALHDKIAGTYVVKVGASTTVPVQMSSNQPAQAGVSQTPPVTIQAPQS